MVRSITTFSPKPVTKLIRVAYTFLNDVALHCRIVCEPHSRLFLPQCHPSQRCQTSLKPRSHQVILVYLTSLQKPLPPAVVPLLFKLLLREPLNSPRPRPRPHLNLLCLAEAEHLMEQLRECFRGGAMETCRLPVEGHGDVVEGSSRSVYDRNQPRGLYGERVSLSFCDSMRGAREPCIQQR